MGDHWYDLVEQQAQRERPEYDGGEIPEFPEYEREYEQRMQNAGKKIV